MGFCILGLKERGAVGRSPGGNPQGIDLLRRSPGQVKEGQIWPRREQIFASRRTLCPTPPPTPRPGGSGVRGNATLHDLIVKAVLCPFLSPALKAARRSEQPPDASQAKPNQHEASPLSGDPESSQESLGGGGWGGRVGCCFPSKSALLGFFLAFELMR